MNDGTVVIDGNATDIIGYAMRGGRIFVRGDVGYRVGIHMKSYKDKQPLIVIGGRAGDFFGEYMAGGNLVLLGLDQEADDIVGNFVGTGMHGGTIYVRGEVSQYRLGREVAASELTCHDYTFLTTVVKAFAQYFALDLGSIGPEAFTKLIPVNKRPYGRLYAY